MKDLIARIETFCGKSLDDLTHTYWSGVSWKFDMTEDFIRKYQDKVSWFDISGAQTLSESFIEEFEDKVYWGQISVAQKLSYEFILNHIDKLNITDILYSNKQVVLTYSQRTKLKEITMLQDAFIDPEEVQLGIKL